MEIQELGDPGHLRARGTIEGPDIPELLAVIEVKRVQVLHLEDADPESEGLADALAQRYAGQNGEPLYLHVPAGSRLEARLAQPAVRGEGRLKVVSVPTAIPESGVGD